MCIENTKWQVASKKRIQRNSSAKKTDMARRERQEEQAELRLQVRNQTVPLSAWWHLLYSTSGDGMW